MPMTLEDHLKYSAQLKSEHNLWLPTWKDQSNYIVPRRSLWDADIQEGKAPPEKIYDTTAINDLQILSDGMQGNLMSPAIPWIDLEMEDKQLQQEEGVADYLEQLETIFLAEYARSNFYEAGGELLTDLGGMGTGIMYMEDAVEKQKIIFSPRHLKECYIAENHEGRVDTLYRDYVMRNRQMEQAWGSKLSANRRMRVKDNPFGKVHVLHACYPQTDRQGGSRKMFASVYIDKDIPAIIDEGGYDMFPYLVPRWRQNTGETYGRGPGSDALPDVLRLNNMARTLLLAAQLAAEPPLNVPEAMKGLERIVPKGFNYYSNPAEIVSAINLGSKYPIAQEQEEQVRQQVHDIFRTKIFLLMQQLQMRGDRTAFEVRELIAEMAAIMAPAISRLNAEFLVPLVERTFAICDRNGLLPEPPAVLTRGGARVRIRFKGRLAQAQEKYHQSEGIVAGLAFVKEVRDLKEDAIDNVNVDELTRLGMDSLGMPQATINEIADIQKTRKIRAKALQMAKAEEMAQETTQTAMSNAEKLNQPMEPGSMIEAAAKAGQKASAAA